MNPIILIQCRLKSKRLPYKAFRPLYGKPLIERLVERLPPFRVMLCTSYDNEDSPIWQWCQDLGIDYCAGSPDNIAARFLSASNVHDTVIRVTGDNPLTDPNIMLDLLGEHKRVGASYTYAESAPRGTKSEIIERGLLEKMIGLEDQEHNFTPWLKDQEGAQKVDLGLSTEHSFTCDTYEDYEKLVKVYDYYHGHPPGIREILNAFEEGKIQKGHLQEY